VTATVRSTNYCTIASLNKKVFIDLCNSFPEIFVKMKEKCLEYNDPWKQFKVNLLKKLDYFESVNTDVPEFLDTVQFHMQDEFY